MKLVYQLATVALLLGVLPGNLDPQVPNPHVALAMDIPAFQPSDFWFEQASRFLGFDPNFNLGGSPNLYPSPWGY